MHILSADAMSLTISCPSCTADCPPVKRLLTRKPVRGRSASLLTALRSAASRLSMTSVRRLVSTIADLSPAKISVSRIALTKSFLSSNDFSLSSNFLLTASARYSASILDDSAASIASLLQISPFSSLTFMSAANLLSIKFSYIPFSSFIALYLIHLQSTFFFKDLTPPPTFARRRQSG